MASPRLLSHTEIAAAQICWARWDFGYGGHLTGGHTLKSRQTPRILSEGRAWGSAVARWHEQGNTLLGLVEASEALRVSLRKDQIEEAERGIAPDPGEVVAIENHLDRLLADYTRQTDALGLVRIEDRVVVPIPSRTGARSSNRYAFECYLDGWTSDYDGRPWLVEFKLRSRLTRVQVLQSSRQVRWYAWALRKASGVNPVGVLIDERLNVAPEGARILKDGSVSEAVNQVTTRALYLEACDERDQEPNATTLQAIDARQWQQRVPIIFRDDELDEAGEELVSAARLIRDLDSGTLYPIRNAVQHVCSGCRFKDICPNPDDDLYVESLFELTEPKRLREPRDIAVR